MRSRREGECEEERERSVRNKLKWEVPHVMSLEAKGGQMRELHQQIVHIC